MLLDPRQIPVMWWNFRNALPVRWTGPAFTATSDEVGVESLELAHEGLTKPLLGQAAALAAGAAQMAGRRRDIRWHRRRRPADQARPHALDPRLVKRLWQRAERPGCIRHSQARAILVTAQPHNGWPATGRPAPAARQRGGGPVGGAATHVTARPTAGARSATTPGHRGRCSTAASSPAQSRRWHPARRPFRPCRPGPTAPGLTPSRRGVRRAGAALLGGAGDRASSSGHQVGRDLACSRQWPVRPRRRPGHPGAHARDAAHAASAASGGPPGPAGGGLPGPVRDGVPGLTGGGLPGSQLNAGPHQPGARPARNRAPRRSPATRLGRAATPPEAPAGATEAPGRPGRRRR